MKKSMILGVVALLGVMLGLQWMIKKNSPRVDSSMPASGTGMQAGQPQQEEQAQQQPAPDQSAYSFTSNQPSAQQGQSGAPSMEVPGTLPKLKGPDGDIKSCEGGSINDILAAHGKAWGYGVEQPAFDPGDSSKLMEEMVQYFGCRAVASRNLGECDHLPTNSNPESKKDNSAVPRRHCGNIADHMLLTGILAGKSKDLAPCIRFMRGLNMSPYSENAEKYCPSFAEGPEKFCPKSPDQKICQRAYPYQKSHCAGKGEAACLDRYNDFMALKSGDASTCSAANKELCRAAISRSAGDCAALAKKVSLSYCEAKKRFDRKVADGGFLAPEDLKNVLDRARKVKQQMQKSE